MEKKLFSRNKKFLILIGLFLVFISFLPLTHVSAVETCATDCINCGSEDACDLSAAGCVWVKSCGDDEDDGGSCVEKTACKTNCRKCADQTTCASSEVPAGCTWDMHENCCVENPATCATYCGKCNPDDCDGSAACCVWDEDTHNCSSLFTAACNANCDKCYTSACCAKSSQDCTWDGFICNKAATCATDCIKCVVETDCNARPDDCKWNAHTGKCVEKQSSECEKCHGANVTTWWYCLLCGVQILLVIPVAIALLTLIISAVIIALLTGFIYHFIVAICQWIIHASLLIGITPANPLTPQIVNIGWTFTRDFVDMFFILIAVFIGLATILKLREYEAKKLLPKLIIIAILMNFIPVIVGFIVDMGNIVTYFLISRAADLAGGAELWQMVTGYFGGLWENITDFHQLTFKFITTTLLGAFIYADVLIWFFIFGSWVYFFVALAFLLRIVNLWILMILSPFAFLSYVFPKGRVTEKLFPSALQWDKWWEEFLMWVIWGIPMGLFLYLSNWIMVNTSVVDTAFNRALLESGLTWFENAFIALVGALLAPTIGLILLHKGYKISKEAAPAAARGIINGVGKVVGIATAIGLTAVTAGAGAGVAAGALGKMAAGAAKAETFLGTHGKGILKPIARGTQWLVGKPAKWATRGMEMAAAPTLLKYAAKTRRIDWETRFKGLEPGEIAQMIDLIPVKQHRVSAAGWMKEKGIFDKPGVSKDFRDKMAEEARSLSKDIHYQKSAAGILESVTRGVDEKTILNFEADPADKEKLKDKITGIADEISRDVKIRPQIEAEMTERKIPLTDANMNQYIRDMAAREIWVDGLKAGDVKYIEKKSLQEDIGTRRGTTGWSSAHMSALTNNFKKEVVDDTLNQTGGLHAMFKGRTPEEGAAMFDKLAKKNPRIVNFFAATPTGREWGWEGLKYMTDPLGRPTNSFAAYKDGLKVQELLKGERELSTLYGRHQLIIQEKMRIEELMKSKTLLENAGKTATPEFIRLIGDIHDHQELLAKHELEAEQYRTINVRNVPDKNRLRKWEEIESLMKAPKIKKREPPAGGRASGGRAPGGRAPGGGAPGGGAPGGGAPGGGAPGGGTGVGGMASPRKEIKRTPEERREAGESFLKEHKPIWDRERRQEELNKKMREAGEEMRKKATPGYIAPELREEVRKLDEETARREVEYKRIREELEEGKRERREKRALAKDATKKAEEYYRMGEKRRAAEEERSIREAREAAEKKRDLAAKEKNIEEELRKEREKRRRREK